MLSILSPIRFNGRSLLRNTHKIRSILYFSYVEHTLSKTFQRHMPHGFILYCIFRMLSILSPIVLNGRCLPRNVHNLKKSRDRCRRVADWVGLPKGGARWSHAIQLKNTVNRQSLRNSHCPQTVGSLRTCSRNVKTAKFTSTGKHRGSLKRIFYLMMWRSPAHHNIKQSMYTYYTYPYYMCTCTTTCIWGFCCATACIWEFRCIWGLLHRSKRTPLRKRDPCLNGFHAAALPRLCATQPFPFS